LALLGEKIKIMRFYSRIKRKRTKISLKNLSKIIHARVVEIVEQVLLKLKHTVTKILVKN
jgi:cell division ATPase FtsA